MVLQTFIIAAHNLSARKSRSALTVLGIVVGVMSISLVWAFGAGLENNVNKSFDKLGTKTLIVQPGTDFASAAFARLEPDDVDHIEAIEGVEWAAEIYVTTKPVSHAGKNKTTAVIGIDMQKVNRFYNSEIVQLDEGRLPTKKDIGSVIIGRKFADSGFNLPLNLKETLQIVGELNLRIITILKKSTNTFAGSFNSAVIVDKGVLQNGLATALKPNEIMVHVADTADIEVVQKKIEERLKHFHGQKDFNVMTASQIAESFKTILGIIQMVLLGLAAISLVVGGIGIMNTVFMNVTERIPEIGVMKAVGATEMRILSIFVAESALLGLIGSLCGIILAYGVVYGAEYALSESGIGLVPVLEPGFALMACLFGMAFGVLSGVLPARWGARLDAVEALRFHA
jgi:putative ABC transport system permease protein